MTKHTTISADLDHYKRVRTAAGALSYDNGDKVARLLRSKDTSEVYKLAAEALGESARSLRKQYGHLNPGMQRMNLGNRMRKALRNKAGAK